MTRKPSILAVDDEEDILTLLAYNLEKDGCAVTTTPSAEDALQRIQSSPPDLILLDVMLPGMSGIDLCKRLKSDDATRPIPVILLSARSEESDVVIGLELGADDYVTKPFKPRELIARIRAHLRRRSAPPSPEGTVTVEGLRIDPAQRSVTAGKKSLDLTFTEFEVLLTLARQPGRVFTRYQIVDAVRGGDYPVTDRSVDVQIAGLRKKLPDGDCIETVRGVGYRFRSR